MIKHPEKVLNFNLFYSHLSNLGPILPQLKGKFNPP